MISSVSTIMRQAKTQLTSIGLCLFYFYIIMAGTCFSGFIFGLISLILKFTNTGVSSWWEIILFILVTWFATQLFIKESLKLIDIDKIQTLKRESSNNPDSIKSNVVPFRRP